ncbi:MAG: hypothetical protein D6746_14805 [Bacteroidetes bacterium]|nr:MAG: hypothetical protein D6746_14805 [Bacteroidota bacterium]
MLTTDKPKLNYYTRAELAEYWGITVSRIDQLAHQRGIQPDLEVGRAYLYTPDTARKLAPRSFNGYPLLPPRD